MVKRQTLGENPLDSLIKSISNNENATAILNIQEESTKPIQKQNKSLKQIITVHISKDVIERLKNAVYWTPGLTLASLAQEAFSKAVDALESARTAPFPKRNSELKTGKLIH